MKISLNITKRFLDFDLPPIKVVIEKIGAQLGAVDEVIDVGARYDKAVIVKVVSCEKHPQADRLSVCLVDDGGVEKAVDRKDGFVEVVCGAPNVHTGMYAVWLPPGATVPDSVGKEPFVLTARELRGVVSNGMLASPKELALGDSHTGILDLGSDQTAGGNFADVFGLQGDYVLDIENKMFTHRPDCFGFLGVARELAGIFNKPFKSPDWYTEEPSFPEVKKSELPLTVRNELPQLVPRFSAITLSNVTVGPSPLWLQDALARLGQKSINNIVDYTNWYMLETGQPLHAYDYDKVKALSKSDPMIVVRQPLAGEKIKLLNGKEVEPRNEAIMIATDKQAIGLGGVMGGSETEVDENTKNIIIEAANFDMYSIRRTSMAHGLFTDAVTRFSKGQSPLQTLAVLARITKEITENSSAETAGPLIDEKADLKAPPTVSLQSEFITSRLGVQLSPEVIEELLTNVEFQVKRNDAQLVITAPFWRTDIQIAEDIVEEVGRLYGYDKLPLELPKRVIVPTVKDSLLSAKAVIRDRLSKAGANEVLTYSFVHGNLMTRTGQDPAKAFELSNALSPDLQYYRLSLMPSLLEKVHPNIKAGYDQFALFELGKTHSLDHADNGEGVPTEFDFTGLVITAADKLKLPGSAFYEAKKYLENLVGQQLVYAPVGQDMQQYPVVQPYHEQRSALVSIKGGPFLGIIGEFKTSVTRNLKLPERTAGWEIDTTELVRLLQATHSYQSLSRFPRVTQDVSFRVDSKVSYQSLYDLLLEELLANRPENTTSSLAPLDIFVPDQPDKKHFTFRYSITNYDRTLTDAEVAKLLEAAADKAKTAYNAERL